MSKTWRKYEKTINTSYLATYRNFLKERIEDFDNDSEEEEKEESKSS